ncbi:MAG: GGDEF domain-containing protein [Gammaproteobacteria bacterium]|nr:GGDEF domain-containing protein [Gammaproteobacteria bacterium]
MDVDGYQALSDLERTQIEHTIEDDLVVHLYQSTRSGTAVAVFVSMVVFALFYRTASFGILIAWFIGFNLTLLLVFLLDLAYRKFGSNSKLNNRQWGLIYAGLIVVCTMFWGASFFLDSMQDPTHQFLSLAVLCMAASSFSTITVGMFRLCIISTGCILLPTATWFLMQTSYHRLGGIFIVLYFVFLLTMNRRSTEWLIHSLKLSKMLASFTHQASHDLLTDLPNQRLMVQIIEAAIEKAKSTQQSFGIICVAINRLESLNSMGYQTGDLIVQALAKRLNIFLEDMDQKSAGSVRHTLTLPRSNAFTVIVEPMTLELMKHSSQQLFEALESPFSLGKRDTKISVSLGISFYPEHGDDVKTLLSNAYTAMFQAKQRGGNQMEVYEPELGQTAPILLELETDLYRAVERKELLVYYQPIIDIIEGKIAGMEALVRWNHPQRGMISPMDFIPLAEEIGLINAIGEWVLEEACTQTVRWRAQGFPLKLAVNLSAKQLWKGNLPDIIVNILEKTGIGTEFLELELTETQILDKKLVPLIKAITDKGISLSIDDFGTGYSGLSYLRFFDVGKIKIDKSFVDDVTTNDNSATIVCAILDMAKAMHIRTLAEGVETKEQLDFLRERGCQYIQGFYFSKPLSSEDFSHYLTRGFVL